MATSKVKLEFKFASVNNACMSLTVNGSPLVPGPDLLATVTIDQEFPGRIDLVVDGKDMNHDTILDAEGNIVQDKHILLTNVTVDRVLVPDHFIQSWPKTSNRSTSYFGFNDQISLNFDDSDSFYWLLKTKR
jgi:hypothetical protein